jgi:hypothetical protein
MAKLEIELTAEEEARISRDARAEGLSLTEYARLRLLEISMEPSPNIAWMSAPHPEPNGDAPVVDAENAAAIAMLNRWRRENATDDPEVIRQATEEYEELKRNLNANRAAAGETPVFP